MWKGDGERGRDRELKAKFLCKKPAEKITRPFAPGKHSDFKCPLGWNTSNSTNSCFRVSVIFSYNPSHEFLTDKKSKLQRMLPHIHVVSFYTVCPRKSLQLSMYQWYLGLSK